MQTQSFNKGFRNLSKDKVKIVRNEIMEALGIKLSAFYPRRRGEVKHSLAERECIERIFVEVGGIAKNEIWGL